MVFLQFFEGKSGGTTDEVEGSIGEIHEKQQPLPWDAPSLPKSGLARNPKNGGAECAEVVTVPKSGVARSEREARRSVARKLNADSRCRIVRRVRQRLP